MAAVAGRIGAMLGEPFTHSGGGGGGDGAGPGFESRVDAGRGRRNGSAEDIIQQPFAAKDRRSAIRIRRCHQQSALGKQAAALLVVGEGYATEPCAVDAGDSVLAREALVEEGVIGVEKFVD